MKLDVNKEVSINIFNELIDNNWFDERTRAVILEFTVYNANTNLFVYSKFVAEFPEVGGFFPYIDIQVFRLLRDSGSEGNILLYVQFTFLLLVIAATVKCLYDMLTNARMYFNSFWNILDIIALATSYVSICIYIYTQSVIAKTLDAFKKDMNEYIGFEHLAFFDLSLNTTFALLVFLLSLRVSRILGYSGKIHEMAAVLTNASEDFIGFIVVFGITCFAFVCSGTLLFGRETLEYKDLFGTYATLTEALVGKNKLDYIMSTNPVFAEVYYCMFVFFVLFTLVTMAASILDCSIAMVRQEQEKIAPTNIVELIFDRLMKLVSKINPSIKYKRLKCKRLHFYRCLFLNIN